VAWPAAIRLANLAGVAGRVGDRAAQQRAGQVEPAGAGAVRGPGQQRERAVERVGQPGLLDRERQPAAGLQRHATGEPVEVQPGGDPDAERARPVDQRVLQRRADRGQVVVQPPIPGQPVVVAKPRPVVHQRRDPLVPALLQRGLLRRVRMRGRRVRAHGLQLDEPGRPPRHRPAGSGIHPESTSDPCARLGQVVTPVTRRQHLCRSVTTARAARRVILRGVTAYDPEQWHDLFVASAGAAAALAGLVFVAVSINIRQILEHRGMPERALQAVLLLLGAVVVSLFGLVPQSSTALGVELLVCGLALTLFFVLSAPTTLRDTRGHPGWLLSRLIATIPGYLPYVVAGISLIAGAGGGLRWVLAGIVGALIGAVVNAWVLLVEILR
jgi:modulator of FtsH protease